MDAALLHLTRLCRVSDVTEGELRVFSMPPFLGFPFSSPLSWQKWTHSSTLDFGQTQFSGRLILRLHSWFSQKRTCAVTACNYDVPFSQMGTAALDIPRQQTRQLCHTFPLTVRMSDLSGFSE